MDSINKIKIITGSRLLIEPVDEFKKSDSGIIISSTNPDKSSRHGTIVMIGNQIQSDIFNNGDEVLYSIYSAVEISIGNHTYHVVPSDEILLILNKSTNEQKENS